MNARRRTYSLARVFLYALLACATALYAGCATRAPHLLDNRHLAIMPTPRGGMPTNPSLIGEAVTTARRAGVNADSMMNKWSELEPAPQKYKLDDPAGGFRYIGKWLGWTIEYTIAVVDTTVKQTPADLQSVRFDDPRTIARFHSLIDALKPVLDKHVAYISVGNEVDIYLARHPDEWDAYKIFLDDAVRYIHANLRGVKVGTATTFEGVTSDRAEKIRHLISNCDVAIITYYPLGPNFIVRAPNSPLTDFPRMTAFAAPKPLVIQEVGYPSSPKLGSTPRDEAEFVDSVFLAWDQSAKQIPFLSYVMLHDLNRDYCAAQPSYYGVP